MTPDRYAKDYILDEKTDENGQISFQYNYHGPVYKLAADQKLNTRVLFLSIAGWLLFVTAMLPKSHAMHAWHVSLPFAFTAIPLFLMVRIALFLKKHERTEGGHGQENGNEASPGESGLKRKEADLINNTWPAAAGFIFALPVISLVGQMVSLIRGRWIMPGDAVFTLTAAALGAVGLVLFKNRPTAKLVSTGSGTRPV